MKEKGEEKERRIEKKSGKKGRNWRDKKRERKKRTAMQINALFLTVLIKPKRYRK